MGTYNYWGYSDSENVGTPSRVNMRRLAFCNKVTFLRTLDDGRRGTKNWIKGRMSITGNHKEIDIINHNLDKMITVEQLTYKILGVTDLVTRDGDIHI